MFFVLGDLLTVLLYRFFSSDLKLIVTQFGGCELFALAEIIIKCLSQLSLVYGLLTMFSDK